MEKIILVSPNLAHEDEMFLYIKEHKDNGEEEIIGLVGLKVDSDYNNWLLSLEKESKKETTSEGRVPATIFLGIRESDGKIVGMINIRHYLNDSLKTFGGHIGYGVRPSERKKGYMTQMLNEGLKYCKSDLKLDKVMLACSTKNIASKKTIEKCGGVFEKESYANDQDIYIYWVNL